MAFWSYILFRSKQHSEGPIYFISTDIMDNDEEGQKYRKTLIIITT